MSMKHVFPVIAVFGFSLFFAVLPAAAQKIYWTDYIQQNVQRADLDGSNVAPLVTSGFNQPYGITLDIAAGKIYWLSNSPSHIWRANFDGTDAEIAIDPLANGLIGIALDKDAGKIYWTSLSEDKIQRANLDGTNIEDVLVFTDSGSSYSPVDIALDTVNGKLYWTDLDTAKIQRADLNGANIEELVTTDLSNPFGIALDVPDNKMYWTDYATGKIQRSDLEGSNVEDLLTGLSSPYGLALDTTGEKMYWTDADDNTIQRANLDGSDAETILSGGLSQPILLAIDPQTAVNSVLTYQGRLQKNGVLVDSPRDMRFSLWTESVHGVQVGPVNQRNEVPCHDGYFTVELDFGDKAFTGKQRWLDITVKGDQDPCYVTLSPRQPLSAAPHAQYALIAGEVSWENITNMPDGFADGIDDAGSDGRDHEHYTLSAKDGVPADIVYVNEIGQVGIGTKTPQARFHVDNGFSILEQQSWVAPPQGLENGWENYGVNFTPAGYYKDSLGIVHLRGVVRNGVMDQPIFTLPADHRPAYRNIFPVLSYPNELGRIEITPTGEVLPVVGNNGFISLTGVSFRPYP